MKRKQTTREEVVFIKDSKGWRWYVYAGNSSAVAYATKGFARLDRCRANLAALRAIAARAAKRVVG